MKEKVRLSYFWIIPLLLSIVAGLLNPYSGMVGVIVPIFAFMLLFMTQKSIVQDTKKIEKKYKADSNVVFALLLNNWMATAFSFLVLNGVINLFFLYVYNMYVGIGETAPMLSYAIHDVFVSNWKLVCSLFVANVFFHIIGTIMIFIDGNNMKKKFQSSLIQEKVEEQATKVVEFLDIKPKEKIVDGTQKDDSAPNENFGIEEDKE
jgi:hypothetical protein